jgi:hypothetical protein
MSEPREMNEPRIAQTTGAFSMSCAVEVNVKASAETIWRLLTDARGFPRWNSTVSGIDGQIRDGQRIRVHAPGTTRTFMPRISDVVPDRRMAWIGGTAPFLKGVRVFVVTPRPDGSTDVAMKERFAGLMLPLAKRSMPDFGPVFTRYANDLKQAAERAGDTQARAA